MAVRPVNGLALCAGIGGLELGLHIAIPGAHAVCFVEREAYAAACLVARMEEASIPVAPIWDDISTFDGRPWRGLVDIVSAGDPCQPWSHAGQRKGYADERVVFDDVARIVDEVQPEFVFLENVAGAIDFRWDCKAVLEGMGYRVEAGLFSAAEVGAPHGRLRIFLLAHSPRTGTANQPRQVDGRGRAGTAGQQRRTTPAESSAKLDDPKERSMWLDGADIGQNTGDVNALADAGAHLADTENGRREPQYETNTESRCGEARFVFSGGGLPMADPGGNGSATRLSGQNQGDEGTAGISHNSCYELPLFPPRPNDLDAWREVLEETRENGPCVEPSIRRMADWTTYRVERLQALGNAVVPLTAAVAFRTLWGRLARGEF